MQLAPVTKDAVIRLALATLVPLAPLLLTLMPLLQRLFGIFF